MADNIIASETPVVKKKKKMRRSLTVAQKLDVISRLENGERPRDICKSMHLPSSTVRCITLQKDKLTSVARECVHGMKADRITRTRDMMMEKLERLLINWIDCHYQRNVNMNFAVIQEKALSLYDLLKKKAEDEGATNISDFKASNGWFERFKKRVNFQNIHADRIGSEVEVVKNFNQNLLKIIEEEGYTPMQIFNVDETGLFWKKLPSRTFIAIDEEQSPGFKISMDRLTLLLGGNLSGDVKLKPFLVYYSENPQDLQNTNLPVIWKSEKVSWVTKEVFADYISGYLSPFVTEYCMENNLDNKILLLIDNAPGHPFNSKNYADNIKVLFLPPNTTSILQPMDQGITSLFKAYYLQFAMEYLVAGSDEENEMSIKQLWKDYNIKMAVENIAAAWYNINQSHMNSVWKALLPNCVNECQSIDQTILEVQNNIVELAHAMGFYGVDQTDVRECLTSYMIKLSDEELVHLGEEICDINNEGGEPAKNLDTRTLTLIFQTCEKAVRIAEENDPQAERLSDFKFKMEEALDCYKKLYNTKMTTKKYY